MDALLERRQPRLVGPDLADDPRPDVRAVNAHLDLADQLIGQVVHGAPIDQRLGRVVGRPVPARAHHDVQAAGLGVAAQAERVAAHAGQGQVHQRAPAASSKRGQLGQDQGVVRGQLPVIPAIRDLPELDAGVLVGQDEAEVGGRHRAKDRLDVARRLARGLARGRGRG
jgi:hypothetical protein